MRGAKVSIVVVLFLLASAPFNPSATLLDAEHTPSRAPAVAMSLDVSRTTITADQALLVSADLLDAAGQPVQGAVNWSVSNGSIEATGLFVPWSAGSVQITGEHGDLQASTNITVVAGRPVGLALDLSSAPVSGRPFRLNAVGVDAQGNEAQADGVAWFIDGTSKGVGMPVVMLPRPGTYDVTMRLNDIEASEPMDVVPDLPVAFVFSEGLSMRSGEGLQLRPELVDANGFSMPWSEVGGVQWSSNHGVIDAEGVFFPNRPGVWNVSVHAVEGNISGNGSVSVLPADAALLDIEVEGGANTTLPAGEEVELEALLSDSLGARAPVVVPLTNWSIPSGRVAAGPNGPLWTPTDTGTFVLTVSDAGLMASRTVTVGFGAVVGMHVASTHATVTAGDSVVLTAVAEDLAQNHMVVNATWSMSEGDGSSLVVANGIAFLEPQDLGAIALHAEWNSPTTNTTFTVTWSTMVEPGRLARIGFDLEQNLVPADVAVDLSPVLTDAFGHHLDGIALNWSVDGIDVTDAMRTSNARWAPSSLGGHVVRANADGVFGLVRLTVEPGRASTLVLDDAVGPTLVAGVPIEVRLDRIDLHGNMGPAINVSTDLDPSVVVVEASTTGPGWWSVLPKQAGPLALTLLADDAELLLDLDVVPGAAVRLFVEVNGTSMSQGGTALVDVHGVDVHGNLVEVDDASVRVTCTAGGVDHLVDGTWVLDLDRSGDDRSCTVTSTEGLIAQTWFEVDAVLLGGVFGSSNTVVSLAGLLLLTVAGLLLAMLRTQEGDDEASLEPQDQTAMVEAAEAKTVVELDGAANASAPPPAPASSAPSPVPSASAPPSDDAQPSLSPEARASMAEQAATTGVMVALEGTAQGSTGWYIDANGAVQHWTVSLDGGWVKTAE